MRVTGELHAKRRFLSGGRSGSPGTFGSCRSEPTRPKTEVHFLPTTDAPFALVSSVSAHVYQYQLYGCVNLICVADRNISTNAFSCRERCDRRVREGWHAVLRGGIEVSVRSAGSGQWARGFAGRPRR